MTRLAVSVEGQTEREFVDRVLAPHLLEWGVFATAVVVTTRRVVSGPNHRGGSINLDRVRSEVRRLQPGFDQVTTLYDFYGFRDKEPGETPDQLLERMASILNAPGNFLPYLQVSEFEALLFSAPRVVGDFLACPRAVADVSDIVQKCGGPEAINDDPQTVPSKRLGHVFKNCGTGFQKRLHGPELAREIGIEAIRRACSRFGGWLTRLEKMGG